MRQPVVSRPHFPPGYVSQPKGLLSWSQVENKLTAARNYWLCTVRPDGRPHAIPKWGVWLEGALYFDGSPETLHSRNIAVNPHVSVNLESGDEVVTFQGLASPQTKPSPELGRKLSQAYKAKYASMGYAPGPESWDEGGLYKVTPAVVLAWTRFTDDPTRFTF